MRHEVFVILAVFAITPLATFFPTFIHASQNAVNLSGDLTLKKDSNQESTGIHFSNSTYQSTASPWNFSGSDIYFNVIGGKVSVGGLPTTSARFQAYQQSEQGQAADFQISGNSSPYPSVTALTSGSGPAIDGLNTGTGRAGYFQLFNTSNGSSAVLAETNGSGYAGEFLGSIKVTGALFFTDGSKQETAVTDCMGRFEDNGDGTVTDCRTGLVWLKDANCSDSAGGIVKGTGALTWADANTWTGALRSSICGLADGSTTGDWRLPTKTEWLAMTASARKQSFTSPAMTNRSGTSKWSNGDPFINIQNYYYWSGSSFANVTSSAWDINLTDGAVSVIPKTNGDFVWPVRSSQ